MRRPFEGKAFLGMIKGCVVIHTGMEEWKPETDMNKDGFLNPVNE